MTIRTQNIAVAGINHLEPVHLSDMILHGTSADDHLVGGAGNDTFYDDLGGNDYFGGEAGNDTFFLGAGSNTADGGSGIDTVDYFYSDHVVGVDLQNGYALADGFDTLISIENASGGSGNDSLLGSSAANHLFGADGNDRMDGRGGNDQLDGSFGNDKLSGGDGNDVLNGQFDGIAWAKGSDNDVLDGGNGNDVLWGGPGNDTLTGGAGADRFVFTGVDGDSFDTITDFVHGTDKLDIRNIDANPHSAGDQAFTFDSTPDGSAEEFLDGLSDDWDGIITNRPGPIINGDPGEVETRYSSGYTYVYLSTGDGLKDADFRIKGDVHLTASDFLL